MPLWQACGNPPRMNDVSSSDGNIPCEDERDIMIITEKRKRGRFPRKLATGLGVLLLLGLGVLLYSLLALTDPLASAERVLAEQRQRLDEARALWEQNRIADYILVINPLAYGGAASTHGCVRGHQPTNCWGERVPTETSITVEGVFTHIEAELERRTCGPNGCECDGYEYLHVDYDPVDGHPIRMATRLTGSNPTAQRCTLVGHVSQITAVELSPLEE